MPPFESEQKELFTVEGLGLTFDPSAIPGDLRTKVNAMAEVMEKALTAAFPGINASVLAYRDELKFYDGQDEELDTGIL